MRNTKAKIIITTLMLLTFLGQAFASAVISCTPEMSMKMSMMTHANMQSDANHTRMMLVGDEQDAMHGVSMDCCQEQCKCPMTSCISLPLLFVLDTNFNVEIIADQKIVQLPLIHQSQINTSLYRPPIS